MSNERERVISITLSESEWQAFIARQPQPVDWLRDKLRLAPRGRGDGVTGSRSLLMGYRIRTSHVLRK